MVRNISSAKKVSINASLSALSLVFCALSKNLVLPFFSFFKLDFSDVPIFISTLILGGSHGYLSILSVSIIRMFIGEKVFCIPIFLLRLSSIVVISFLNIYNKVGKHFFILCAIASLVLSIIRIPISYDLWVNYFHVKKNIFCKDMRPTIIYLTFFRTMINLIISKLLYNRAIKVLKGRF